MNAPAPEKLEFGDRGFNGLTFARVTLESMIINGDAVTELLSQGERK